MENLTLALEQTGHSWTLHAENQCQYQVGTRRDCDITLPCVNFASDLCLELSYDSGWYVRDNGSLNGIFIDDQRLDHQQVAITGDTHIRAANGMLLIAKLTSNSPNQITSDALITPTRLLSGYAYLAGLTPALELLNQLRSDPYKAAIPEDSSLDLEKVITHTAQSVVITLTFSCLALGVFLLELLFIFIDTFYFSNWGIISDWLSLAKIIPIMGIIPGLLIAFESVYLRWFNARRFLKKDYTPNTFLKFLPLFLENIVNYLKQSIIQIAPLQNIITFAGSNPFIGSGELIPASRWTVPITRKKKETSDSKEAEDWRKAPEYIDIPVTEFYQAIEEGIEQLNLPNLTKFTRLYMDGFELEPDGKFLLNATSRPAVMLLDDPLLFPEQSKLSSRQRAYRVYQYVDHERDYIISYFLRFYNAGSVTFVESSAYILAGIDRQRFSLSSTIEDTQFSRIVKMIIAAIIFSSGIYLGLALWYLGLFIFYLISWKRNDFQQRRAACFQEEYNYGIEQTFREFIAEPVDFNQQDRLRQKIYRSKNPINQFIINPLNLLRKNILGILILFVFLPLVLPFLFFSFIFHFLLTMPRNLTEPKVTFDYYGTQDLLMYWKALQTNIFSNTLRILKIHNIDTSDFESLTKNRLEATESDD